MNILTAYYFLVNEVFVKDKVLSIAFSIILENVKESVEKGNAFGPLLTYTWKAFDCISHKLLIAQLFWYGVSRLSLNLCFNLSNKAQSVKKN